MKTADVMTQLKAQTEALVKRGDDVRAGTARLVEEASGQFYHAKDGLNGLVKAVAEGAISGADQALPDASVSALKQVVDGITDGLTKSAQAVQLTVEEATASGSRFANEDLKKIVEDFRVVTTVLTDILTTAAEATGGHLKEQAKSLGEHAQTTLQNLRPGLESALHAAMDDPAKLGRETVQAGATAVRQAAGVLFSQLGKSLGQLGERLRND